jgi:hypothetical protein
MVMILVEKIVLKVTYQKIEYHREDCSTLNK